jgi:hypothetical protein
MEMILPKDVPDFTDSTETSSSWFSVFFVIELRP